MERNWTDEAMRRLWEHENTTPEHYFTYQIGENLVNYLAHYFKENDSILDYGCGSGFLEEFLLNNYYSVTAMDFTPNSVDLVNDKYKGYGNFNGAFYYEDLVGKDKFDVILCLEVIEHLDDKYLKTTMENFRKLLKEDGLLVLTTPNNEDLKKSYMYCPFCDTDFHKMQHIRSWSVDSLTDFLVYNRFEIISMEELNFNYVGNRCIKDKIKAVKWQVIDYIKQSVNNKTLFPKIESPNLLCVAKMK